MKYILYRLIGRIIYSPQSIKYFLQRLFRGYGDDDLWSLDHWILKKIRKPFKAFVKNQREYGNSYPVNLITYKKVDSIIKTDTHDKWIQELEHIEEAIDLMWLDYTSDDKWFKMTTEEFRIAYDKINKGWKLFGEYFGDFWD